MSLQILWAIFVAGAAPEASQVPTFTKDVAPILWRNCADCHRPGEVGPFSLLEYEDAAKRAEFLASVTASRTMPPWKAEPNFGRFHDERRLTDAQIDLLRRWAEAGAPRGDAADLPERPTFVEGWQLGKPDLVLEMPTEFAIPADGPDIYQCFVIPIPIDGHRTVAAAEFRPGNRRVAHHAILYLDANGAARRRDEQDPALGYRSFGGPGVLPTGGLGGWAPGAVAKLLPDGTGKFLRKGSDLVLQMHYHPSGKPETERSSVGIYFTKRPVTTFVGGLAIMNHRLDIPPGEKHYRVTAQSEALPVDVNLLGLGPHMHLLGREIKVTGHKPSGEIVPLIWVKDWDFNWQGSYGFLEPVRLPKGSVIRVEAEYDNSPDNPHNPNSPPRRVTWGEQTTDEMCLVSVQLTTDTTDDLRQIVKLRGARLGGALAGGVEEQDLEGGAPADDRSEQLVDLVVDRGFPIPEPHRERLKSFDDDADGRITRREFERMPVELRTRIRTEILRRVRTAVEGAAEK